MDNYESQLPQIRDFLKTQRIVPHTEPFPYNHCDRSARVVRELTGLEVVTGTIQTKTTKYVHTCNYDPKTGRIIDITRDQFGFKFPEIIVEPAQNSVFEPLPPKENEIAVKITDELLETTVKKLADAYRAN